MNEKFLTLLESEDVDDNIAALSIFENNYDMMFEDSDPTDGVSDSEVEAIKRRKEKQKKIVKTIAICTGGIATCVAIIASIKKLKKKGSMPKGKADQVEAKANKILAFFKKILSKAKGLLRKKTLTEAEAEDVDDMYDEAENLNDQMKQTQSEHKDYNGYTGIDESAEYDRVVDAILEKFNDDAFNAETCIALMERASERYLTESSYSSEYAYESAINEICESYVNGEISDKMYELMIEAANNKYL